MSNGESDIYCANGGVGDQYDFDSEIAKHNEIIKHHREIVSNLEKLQSMREMVIRDMKKKEIGFFVGIHSLISDWQGQYPNLRKMFRPKEMDWLLTSCIDEEEVIDFVIKSGYNDEPEMDEEGKPLLNRSTPVHYAGRCHYEENVLDLFKIYDRLDVNYIDESGYTHFHVACQFGCDDIVQKFLELGQDPNLLTLKTVESQKKEDEGDDDDDEDDDDDYDGDGDDDDDDDDKEESGYPPLHSALHWQHQKVVELLLKNGADPNLTDAKGLTPLHIISGTHDDEEGLAEFFFKICDELQQTVQIDATDNLGNAPLHISLDEYDLKILPELLLRRGANPNLANGQGMTPLHNICKYSYEKTHELLERFFKATGDTRKQVRVDARDKFGRTPLQLTVINGLPRAVDALLDRGADLSGFEFPAENHFDETLKQQKSNDKFTKLLLASGVLAAVERLEKRGFELDRGDALTIMEHVAKLGLLEKPTTNLDEQWYDDEAFANKAKKLLMKPGLPLYDLIRLRMEKAEKLFTYADYLEFTREDGFWSLPRDSKEQACAAQLSEITMKRFCRRWARDYFLELTRYQLPILCCDMIVEQLRNEDLCNICFAAAGRGSVKSVKRIRCK